jgi:hypothetical protein
MASLSEVEMQVCDENPIGDGLDRFLDEFEPVFKSFSLSEFEAVLRSDQGKFAHIHGWIMLTES